jgi:serine protease Do
MEQIVERGHVRRGRIGVSIKNLTPDVGVTPVGSMEGAMIADVSRGSPAERGGIQKGDIVVAADGTPIRSAARLRNKLGLTPVGERVQLTVKRNGVVHQVSVEVAPQGETTGTISGNRQPRPRAGLQPARPLE